MKILLSGFTSGQTIEKILEVEYFDKVMLFSPPNFIGKVNDFLKRNKIKGNYYKIDSFNLNSQFNIIGDRIKKKENEELVVNITEGNNLMAATFLSIAYYYGLRTYFVLKGKIIKLPTTSLKDNKNYLTSSAKKWLIEIKQRSGSEGITLKDLSKGVNSQTLTVPLKILKNAGLIEITMLNKRTKYIKLTPLGNMYSRFMMNTK